MKNRRETKQLMHEILLCEWYYHNTPDPVGQEAFYELGVEHSEIYKRLTGHYPTRVYQKWMSHGNKIRGNKQ